MERKPISKEMRKNVHRKYGGHCAYCGCQLTIKQMQVDHLVPLMAQKSALHIGVDLDCIDNYMPSCRSCNQYKSTYSLEKFRVMIERQPEILSKYKSTYRLAVKYGLVIPNPKPVVFYFENQEVKD